MNVTPCPTCEHPTVARADWDALPKPRWARRRLRGVCVNCARQLDPGEPKRMLPREEVVTEWQWLHDAGELSRAQSRAQRIRQAAPRIGMSEAALEKALDRAGAAA